MKKGVQLQTGNTTDMQVYPTKKIVMVSIAFVLAVLLIIGTQQISAVYASIASLPSGQCSGDFNDASYASGFSNLAEMNDELFNNTNAASTSQRNATLMCSDFEGAVPDGSQQKFVVNVSWAMKPSEVTEQYPELVPEILSTEVFELQSDIDTNNDTVVVDLDGNVISIESETSFIDEPVPDIQHEVSVVDEPVPTDDVDTETLPVREITISEIINESTSETNESETILPESVETVSFFWDMFIPKAYAEEVPEIIESQEDENPSEPSIVVSSIEQELITLEQATTPVTTEDTIQLDTEDSTDTIVVDIDGVQEQPPSVVMSDTDPGLEMIETTSDMSLSLQSDIDTNNDTVIADLDGEFQIIKGTVSVPRTSSVPSSAVVEILYNIGADWETLEFVDEVDGLASFELPHTVVAGDLSNLTIAIRNLQQLSDRTLYVDAVWIDVQVPQDQIIKTQPQEVSTRMYDTPFVIDPRATHRCSSE
ncbi:hypothetical protein KC901_01365, partial [Patescibacteria group bacterium]|nr:hypothetical protein [Patescibacteria group bacterium]